MGAAELPPDLPAPPMPAKASPRDLIIIAILERVGILTNSTAQALAMVINQIIPLNYEAALSTVSAVIDNLPYWETCESCRRLMGDYRVGLTNFHNAGHPVPVVESDQQEQN